MSRLVTGQLVTADHEGALETVFLHLRLNDEEKRKLNRNGVHERFVQALVLHAPSQGVVRQRQCFEGDELPFRFKASETLLWLFQGVEYRTTQKELYGSSSAGTGYVVEEEMPVSDTGLLGAYELLRSVPAGLTPSSSAPVGRLPEQGQDEPTRPRPTRSVGGAAFTRSGLEGPAAGGEQTGEDGCGQGCGICCAVLIPIGVFVLAELVTLAGDRARGKWADCLSGRMICPVRRRPLITTRVRIRRR